jgi:hypothetical protein
MPRNYLLGPPDEATREEDERFFDDVPDTEPDPDDNPAGPDGYMPVMCPYDDRE